MPDLPDAAPDDELVSDPAIDNRDTADVDDVDGFAAGAVACAFASFLVPIVLAVAALILARASELSRATDDGEPPPPSRNDSLVSLARIVAWTNIVLACAFLIFLLLGITARVVA